MRVYNYLIIIVGLMILFNLAGITTTVGTVLQSMDIMHPENITLKDIFIQGLAAITAIGVTAIIIGAFTKSSTESILLIGYAELLLLFIADMVFVVIYMNAHYSGWMASLVALIMTPLAIGYLHSVISWWGGKA